MAIQIEQRMPKCQRCGKMIHIAGERFALPGADRRSKIVFCSDRCRREYEALVADAQRTPGAA